MRFVYETGLRPQNIPNDNTKPLQILAWDIIDQDHLHTEQYDFLSAKKDIMYHPRMPSFQNECSIIVFGVTETGLSITTRIKYQPFLFIEVEQDSTSVDHENIISNMARIVRLNPVDLEYELITCKRLYGWIPNEDGSETKKFTYLKVRFPSIKALRIAGAVLAKGVIEVNTPYHWNELDTKKLTKDISKSIYRSDFQLQPKYDERRRILKYEFKDLSQLETAMMAINEVRLKYNISIVKISHPKNVYEHKISPSHKFTDDTEINPSGWFEIPAGAYNIEQEHISHAQLEVSVEDFRELKSLPDFKENAPFLQASFDIECYSKSHQFPNSTTIDDAIVGIGTSIQKFGTDPEVPENIVRVYHCLKEHEIPDDYNGPELILYQYDTEKDLLLAWRDFIVCDVDPEILLGYNTSGFDWRYIMERYIFIHTGFSKRLLNAFVSHWTSLQNPMCKRIEYSKSILTNSKSHIETSLKNRPKNQKNKPIKVSFITLPEEDAVTLNPFEADYLIDRFNGRNKRVKNATLEGIYNRVILNSEEEQLLQDFQTKALQDRFFYQSRLFSEFTPLITNEFSSSAYGTSISYCLNLNGRLDFDLYKWIMREEKLSNYSLNSVSKTFLGAQKVDLPAQEMFKCFESEDPQIRGKIGVYCSMDCDLPLRLIYKKCTIQNLIEMSRVTYTTCANVVSRGQQIKVYNQLIYFSHRHGFVLNPPNNIKWGKYQGATVLDPKPGFYTEPIVVLDFASLYPSVIMAKNFCYSTWVKDPRYLGLPGAEYETIKTAQNEYTFVKHISGVLPKILEYLLNARKAVKREMKTIDRSTNQFYYNVLNGKQLAYKISCNSVYGFCGTGVQGKYPCMAIADSTTAVGRQMIDKTQKYILENYEGSRIIYGDTDSVMVIFPHDKNNPVESSWQVGERAANEITSIFQKYIILEIEKIYYPSIFWEEKKRYIGMKYVWSELLQKFTKPTLAASGVELQRRDSCKFVQNTYEKVVLTIMDTKSVEKGVEVLDDTMYSLVNGEIPFEELVLSRKLGKNYKNTNIAQYQVMLKTRERAPGSEPRPGDRVQFVVLPGPKKAPLYSLVEDADYALKHNLQLNYHYYLTKGLKNPITNLLKPFMTPFECENVFRDAIYAAECKLKQTVAREKYQDLSLFFVKKKSGQEKKRKFSVAPPSRRLKKRKDAPKTKSILSFLKKD